MRTRLVTNQSDNECADLQRMQSNRKPIADRVDRMRIERDRWPVHAACACPLHTIDLREGLVSSELRFHNRADAVVNKQSAEVDLDGLRPGGVLAGREDVAQTQQHLTILNSL